MKLSHALPRHSWLRRLSRRGKLSASLIVVLLIGVGCTAIHATLTNHLSYSAPAAREPGQIRLMTFNIAHGRGLAVDQRLIPDSRFKGNLDQLAAFVEACDSDLAALQEVDQNSSWNGNFDHLAYMRESTTMDHAAIGLNNQNGGRYKLNYGNGTLSRYPFIAREHQAFGDATLGEKGFLYTRTEINGHVLDLINVHLDFRSEKRRQRQVAQIISFIQEQHEAAPGEYVLPFVVGDFNSEASRKDGCIQTLLEALSTYGEYRIVPTEETPTFSVYAPKTTIDLVLVPPTYAVERVQVMPVKLSDHLPVIVDLVPAPR